MHFDLRLALTMNASSGGMCMFMPSVAVFYKYPAKDGIDNTNCQRVHGSSTRFMQTAGPSDLEWQ